MKLPIHLANAAIGCLGSLFISQSHTHAAILATGEATLLSQLGFQLAEILDDPSIPGGYTSLSALASPFGNVTFSPQVQKAYVGSDWKTWSNGYQGAVYYSGFYNGQFISTTTLTLPANITAFDLYVQPNAFTPLQIAVTASDIKTGSSATLTQTANGDAGARYVGFYTTGSDRITQITVTDPSNGWAVGFAMGQFRLAQRVPVPRSIPEPSSLAGLLLISGIGISRLYQRHRLSP